MNWQELKPNPENPRTIGKAEFERLKEKIKRVPDGLKAHRILHKDGIIYAGNQRYRALKELGKEGFEIKDDYFIDGKDWTQEQIDEYVITDNVSDGSWDWDILANGYNEVKLQEYGVVNPEWDLSLDDINSTEDRTAPDREQTVTCPECNTSFTV